MSELLLHNAMGAYNGAWRIRNLGSHSLCGRSKTKGSETTFPVGEARQGVRASTPYIGTCGRGMGDISEDTPHVGGAKQGV